MAVVYNKSNYCHILDSTTQIVTDYPYIKYQTATYTLVAVLLLSLIGVVLLSIALTRTRGCRDNSQSGFYY